MADKASTTPSRRRAEKGAATASSPPDPQSDVGLTAALRALDELLGMAVDRQARLLGPATLLDPWRGMHLDADDVKGLLARRGHVAMSEGGAAQWLAKHALEAAPVAQAARWLELEAIDVATLLIAIAPDIDLRYERIYAYLQDDMTRKRPGADLVANLLAVDVSERLQLLRRLDVTGPLMRHGVLERGGTAEMPELARPLAVDCLWRNYVMERDIVDPQLLATTRVLAGEPRGLAAALVEPATRAMLERLLKGSRTRPKVVRVMLQGPHGVGKLALARCLAGALGTGLLSVDVRQLGTPDDVARTLQRALCMATLQGRLIYVFGVERLSAREPQLLRALSDALAAAGGSFVVSLVSPLPALHAAPLRAVRLELAFPSAALRERAWVEALKEQAIDIGREDIERVASRFTLSSAQIAQAAVDVSTGLRLAGSTRAAAGNLAVAARALCGDELARLTQRIHPQAGFDALIATPETEAQLREICARVANGERVRRDWTRDSIHARRSGITALFTGPSGTGKTLACEVIAHELGFDLFRIDLAAVVSKYIGETEKNLDRVFTAAAHANAVLFFDEADALFGKRSEVKDAHDRYANVEIAYLLQKMDQFDGLAILATNLKQNLDEAFTRRLTFCVGFAFPEASERRRLWDALWPSLARRADDVDLDWFAQEYRLSGGNIRNTVLAAVHLAAANGQVVSREHLLHATRREYQKLGKNIAHPGPVPQRLAS